MDDACLDGQPEFDCEVSGWTPSHEEINAMRAVALEVIEFNEGPSYRSKSSRYRPWPNDPVSRIALPGQANKNLPLRSAFPLKSAPKSQLLKSRTTRFEMEGPDGSWTAAYKAPSSPALKRILLRFQGPWKTRRWG
jgi:hypothetical protein